MDEKVRGLFSLAGKVAVITGGAGRLGQQHALALQSAGARVHSFDTAPLETFHGVGTPHCADITDEESVRGAVAEVIDAHGQVDILINNAVIDPPLPADGEPGWEPYPDFPIAKWRREVEVGLTGAHIVTTAIAPYFEALGTGSIINVSSTSGITAPDHRKYPDGRFKSSAYPVVKTALLGLTRAWASYFSKTAPGIRVNAICFGAVNFKEITPELLEKLKGRNMLGRPARPDEYWGGIIFLASDASVFMTAQTLIMDGGQTAW